jgi:hypothetical protein
MKNSIKTLVISALMSTTFAQAQSWFGEKIKGNGKQITEKRTTVEYDEIKLLGFYEVDLIAGKEGEISVQAEQNLMPYIKIEVEGSVLKIYQEKDKNLIPSRGKSILITVPFEVISAISLTGSGDIHTKNTIKTDKFTASLSGSGDLNLEVEVKEFDVKISGSGDFILKGKTDNLITKISGSGDIKANELDAKNADIAISGSGDVRVVCTENLKARVSGSGDVIYYGNPKSKDAKVSGSGNIRKG